MLATNSLQTPTLGLVARRGVGRFDADHVRARLAVNTLPQTLADYGLTDEFSLLGSFVAGPRALARFAGDAPLNTDDHPVVAYRAPRITYASDSLPQERLLALLEQFEVTPAEVLTGRPDAATAQRLAAYWAARDRFIVVGQHIRASADLQQMLSQVREPLLSVLRLLLEERVSIRNLPLILEAIAEARSLGSPEAICEYVRQRLGFQLVAELKRDDGTIPLIQLAPEWEKTFATYQIDTDRGMRDVALPPEQFSRLANALADRLNRAAEAGTFPALVTSTLRRRFLRTVLGAKGLSNPVLSYEEIGLEARPAMVGMVPA